MSEDRRRIDGAPPFRMSQNFAEAGIVRFVVQHALHAIHFRINFVAIERYHGQSGARIDVVGPVAFRSDLAAQFTSEFQKLLAGTTNE